MTTQQKVLMLLDFPSCLNVRRSKREFAKLLQAQSEPELVQRELQVSKAGQLAQAKVRLWVAKVMLFPQILKPFF